MRDHEVKYSLNTGFFDCKASHNSRKYRGILRPLRVLKTSLQMLFSRNDMRFLCEDMTDRLYAIILQLIGMRDIYVNITCILHNF